MQFSSSIDSNLVYNPDLEPNQKAEQVFQIINSCCTKIFDIDGQLLKKKVHEQAVSHRLAVYLEHHFPTFHVDCEYNKLADGIKILFGIDPVCFGLTSEENRAAIKARWAIRERSKHGLRPDITVHWRGERNKQSNVLVVEVKIGTVSRLDFEDSCIRLNEFTSGGQEVTYQFGALINFNADTQPIQLFFQNGVKPLSPSSGSVQ